MHSLFAADAPWPGWQFYAAVNFGPQGGLWRDLPSSTPTSPAASPTSNAALSANDLLLYITL